METSQQYSDVDNVRQYVSSGDVDPEQGESQANGGRKGRTLGEGIYEKPE